MSIPQAWFCPSCQRYHAPHVETCPGDHQGVVIGIHPWIPAREYREPHQWVPETYCPHVPPFYVTSSGGITVEPDPNVVLM